MQRLADLWLRSSVCVQICAQDPTKEHTRFPAFTKYTSDAEALDAFWTDREKRHLHTDTFTHTEPSVFICAAPLQAFVLSPISITHIPENPPLKRSKNTAYFEDMDNAGRAVYEVRRWGATPEAVRERTAPRVSLLASLVKEICGKSSLCVCEENETKSSAVVEKLTDAEEQEGHEQGIVRAKLVASSSSQSEPQSEATVPEGQDVWFTFLVSVNVYPACLRDYM
jgi:hypothetical protein